VTADYAYDGLERLAVRTTANMMPAGTTHYLYDRAGRLLAEADSTGQTLREYVWLDDLPLVVVTNVDTVPKIFYVHADQLNRPIKMTNAAQLVAWDAVYKPFGEGVSITGTQANNLRFPGQYFLIEDGLHYNWYRHYDPTLGRYVQADPLGFVDGPSVYAYAESSPGMYNDPTGQFAPIIVGIGVVIAYVLTPTIANAPGPGDETTPVDDLSPFENAAGVAACLSPHYWWSLRSMGVGFGRGETALESIGINLSWTKKWSIVRISNLAGKQARDIIGLGTRIMTKKRDWASFCQRAATIMRAALENKIPLKEASDFFENDKTITDPDLRRYVESMIWEIDGSRDYFMKLLEMFELQSTEEEFVRYLND
jgi:RHS repeat-associated protein